MILVSTMIMIPESGTNTWFNNSHISTDMNHSLFIYPSTNSTEYDKIEITSKAYEEFNKSEPKTTKIAAASQWTLTFDRVTATLTIIGVIANILCFISLHAVHKGFAAGILFLLRVQSFLDAVSCLFAVLLLLAPPLWVTGK